MTTPVSEEVVLDVRGVSLAFGGLRALDDVRLTIARGECVGVIGPNGAGKSTLLNCLSGLYEVSQESVLISGVACGGARPSSLVKRGVKRTFQNIETFREMTVREVLAVGACHLANRSIIATVVLPGRARREADELAKMVDEAASSLDLAGVMDEHIEDLPYGTQKRVDLARALVGGARLLLLDEPAAGLSDEEIDDIAALLIRLRGDGVLGMLLVEHHLDFVRRVADRLYVLETGTVIAEGTPDEVLSRPEVVEAYIGVSVGDG